MTAYVHANVLAEYAKDAAISEKPWEGWEFTHNLTKDYFRCRAGHTPGLCDAHEYRRIKKTKTVMCRNYVFRATSGDSFVSIVTESPEEFSQTEARISSAKDFIRWVDDWFPVEVEA